MLDVDGSPPSSQAETRLVARRFWVTHVTERAKFASLTSESGRWKWFKLAASPST